jgi:hypothetical protein
MIEKKIKQIEEQYEEIIRSLTARQIAALCLFLQHRFITRALIREVLSAELNSRSGAWRVLSELKLMRLIQPEGDNKATKYKLTQLGKEVLVRL